MNNCFQYCLVYKKKLKYVLFFQKQHTHLVNNMIYSIEELRRLPMIIEKCSKMDKFIQFPCRELFPCIETWGDLSNVDENIRNKYDYFQQHLIQNAASCLNEHDKMEGEFRRLHELLCNGQEIDSFHHDYYHSIKIEMTQLILERLRSIYNEYLNWLKPIKNAKLLEHVRIIPIAACKLYLPMERTLPPNYEQLDPLALREQLNITFCDCSEFYYKTHFSLL